MFCQENSLSTAKHPADHTSPCLLELCSYLFLRSCSEKPPLCKVRLPSYLCPHTIHLASAHLPSHAHLSVYLSIHPSMHPFYSLYRSSDQLPSHNQPALKGKAESFISINHSPLHYHRYNLQTSCVKLNLDIDWSIFTPLPTLPPTDPHSDPSARLCLRFQPQCFDEARYLYLKTTCNFLVSQGGRCFTATC